MWKKSGLSSGVSSPVAVAPAERASPQRGRETQAPLAEVCNAVGEDFGQGWADGPLGPLAVDCDGSGVFIGGLGWSRPFWTASLTPLERLQGRLCDWTQWVG